MRVTRPVGMAAGLAAGMTLAVLVPAAVGMHVYAAHHASRLLDSAREAARAEGELIRDALEYQMLVDDRDLLAKMIRTFGRRGDGRQLVLLDRAGAVQFSSRPVAARDVAPGSPTCQACHQLPADRRATSRVLDMPGGAVLRTVLPILNRPACHECHDPSDRINGVLILDVSVDAVRAGMDRDLRTIAAATTGLALVLVAGIALVFRVVVLRRLRRFENAARLIAAGDLSQRIPAEGTDTLSWLAREFNLMADAMTGLVDRVHGDQRRLETILNSIDDGIVVLDPQRKVMAANDAFLARAGVTRDAVLGCGCRDPGSGVCAADECPAVLSMETRRRQVRIMERRAPDGTVRWEEVHASPLVAASGELVQVVEVWRDISDRRTAEARLAESHRLASLGMLASGFSHELNTPLATVLTCVEGILHDAANAPDAARPGWDHVERCAATARDQVLRCRSITRHFLQMSRGEGDGPALVNLEPALSAVLRIVEPTARSHGVSLTYRPPPEPACVRASEAQLQQVIVNLLLNAIQASQAGMDVTLEVLPGDPVRIRVRDRGCGIDPALRSRIFEPFVSLRPGGTGLGLFLSLEIARHWGGDISAESEPGKGAVFEVALPRAGSMAEGNVA